MPTNEAPGSSPATDRRHGYAARMDRRAGCPFGGDEPCGGCHGDCWTDAEQEREPEPLEQPSTNPDDEPAHWSSDIEALAAHRARGW